MFNFGEQKRARDWVFGVFFGDVLKVRLPESREIDDFALRDAPDWITLTPSGELTARPTERNVGDHVFIVRFLRRGDSVIERTLVIIVE